VRNLRIKYIFSFYALVRVINNYFIKNSVVINSASLKDNFCDFPVNFAFRHPSNCSPQSVEP
jgi:hypothetical protein